MKENVSLLLLILPSFVITLNCRKTEGANGFEEKGLLLDPHSQPKPEAPEHHSVTDTHCYHPLTSVILVTPACALKDLQWQSFAPLLLPFHSEASAVNTFVWETATMPHYYTVKQRTTSPYIASWCFFMQNITFLNDKQSLMWLLAFYLVLPYVTVLSLLSVSPSLS